MGGMLSDIDYDKIIKAMIQSTDSSQYTPSKFKELDYNTKEVVSSFIFLDYSATNSFLYNDHVIFTCDNKNLIQKFYNEYSQFFMTAFDYIFEAMPIADKIVGGIGMVGEIEDNDATGSVTIQRAPSLYDEIKESTKEDYQAMQENLVNKIGNILHVNNAILAGQYIKVIYDYTIDTVYSIFSHEVDDV